MQNECKPDGWRWKFEDQDDTKWNVQKHKPHWYKEIMTDIIIEPLFSLPPPPNNATVEGQGE